MIAALDVVQKVKRVNHILFQCPYARLIWTTSPIHAPPQCLMSDSLYYNLHRVLSLQERYPPDEAYTDLVPWLFWRLWKNRNEFLFQDKYYSAQDTVNKAIENTAEWMSRQEENNIEVKKPTSNKQPVKWKPPIQNWTKCNTDGAWHKNQQGQGIGWISRDHTGRLLWAGAQRFEGLDSHVETEATALNWAIKSMSRLDYSQVIFETDAQVLVKMIEGVKEIWPKLKPIIQDITHSLKMNSSFKVEFFSRDGNKTTYKIAKEAFSFMNHVPKLYSIVPSWLKPVLEADMPYVGLN
ncbi:uncharacterized protein LOC108845037 [Raphanus sativus]|uniref:Uncharacterized protein LOC108845037 n=1 Tax=Raphanus sativus TaxID=3726 RepID=A0A6J0MNU8_RAPSA|nr:uncharacterized protein LOC108845037 [Raphanus sativus]